MCRLNSKMFPIYASNAEAAQKRKLTMFLSKISMNQLIDCPTYHHAKNCIENNFISPITSMRSDELEQQSQFIEHHMHKVAN